MHYNYLIRNSLLLKTYEVEYLISNYQFTRVLNNICSKPNIRYLVSILIAIGVVWKYLMIL